MERGQQAASAPGISHGSAGRSASGAVPVAFTKLWNWAFGDASSDQNLATLTGAGLPSGK